MIKLLTAAQSVLVATGANVAETYYWEANSGALHKKCPPLLKYVGVPSQNGFRVWCYCVGAMLRKHGQKSSPAYVNELSGPC